PRENINTKPVVNAGEDKTIYSDETIQFLATASDGDNDPLTYQWELVGEPAGQLTGASLLGVSYHAPHLQPGSDNLVLTFKLTVTDGKDSVSDTVNVTVKPQSGSGKGSLTVAGGATDIVPTGPVTLTFNYAPMTDHSSLGSLTLFGTVSPMVDLLQLATVNTGVTFYDGDVVLCANVTLVNNKASCTVSLAPGPHNLRAVYNSGEVSVEPASDTLIVTAVDKAGPSATAIGSFLSDRANLIVTNLPGMDRQIDRLNAAQAAKGGLDTSSNLAASGKGDLLLSDKGDLLPLEKGDLLLNTTRLGSGPSGASITASRLGVSSGTEVGSTNVGQQGLLGFQSFLYNYLRSSGESGNFGHFNFSGPMDMQANFNSGSSQASFKTSLAQMMAWQQQRDHNDMASLGFGTGRAPDYFMPFDMWMEGVYSSYSGTRSGTFGMATVGADYVFNPSFLVGFYGQFDAMAQSTAAVEGKGWMTGPYVTARIGENVFWQGRAGWGKSSNTINLDGSGADNFGSSRWLVSSSLSGKWRWGDGLAFAPTASFSYFEDKSDGYVDHFGVNIPGLKTNLGQIKLSPELSYGFLTDSDLWIEPSLATELIWNFASTNVDGLGSLDGDATGPAGLRGRVKAGLNIRMPSGILLGASGVYDGIGSGNYSAIAGQITVTVPLN
ncbi:MAG: autotransporter outer membrane beta-barrel domain-containing protein, partial [Aestuariivirga sp.]